MYWSLGCLAWVCQVRLMEVVPEVRAAMRAHAGVAAVADSGVAFLRNLATLDANRVSARLPAWHVADSVQRLVVCAHGCWLPLWLCFDARA
jgi:hypothetical protein